jgi:hypothetical protein
MTITGPDARSAGPGQAVVDAAMLVLERMGLTPADLLAAPAARPAALTFAEYIPVVSALVSDGCRKAYGLYWTRVTEQWGSRRIDEPTPSEIRQLVQHVRANVVPRRNSRAGRSAAEHLIAALRCMYKHTEEDGLIDPADNPARKVEKPRRLPSTRRAVADNRLAEINHAATITGDDPEVDTLLLRLATPAGKKLYQRRAALVEPAFAQFFARFGRYVNYRGRDAVDTEIKLLVTVHNLGKLLDHRRRHPALAT